MPWVEEHTERCSTCKGSTRSSSRQVASTLAWYDWCRVRLTIFSLRRAWYRMRACPAPPSRTPCQPPCFPQTHLHPLPACTLRGGAMKSRHGSTAYQRTCAPSLTILSQGRGTGLIRRWLREGATGLNRDIRECQATVPETHQRMGEGRGAAVGHGEAQVQRAAERLGHVNVRVAYRVGDHRIRLNPASSQLHLGLDHTFAQTQQARQGCALLKQGCRLDIASTCGRALPQLWILMRWRRPPGRGRPCARGPARCRRARTSR